MSEHFTSHFSPNLPSSHSFDTARCSKPGFPDQNVYNLNLQTVEKVLTVQAMPGRRSNCTTPGLLSCVAAGLRCRVAGPSGPGGSGAVLRCLRRRGWQSPGAASHETSALTMRQLDPPAWQHQKTVPSW